MARWSVLLAGIAAIALPLSAAPVFVNDASSPIYASSLDQPELYTLVRSGTTIIEDADGPVLLETFVDTGSSGNVLSNLSASSGADYGVQTLNLTPSDYVGTYTEIGVAGTEAGHITRPLGLLVANVVPGTVESIDAGAFVDYGDHGLWARDSVGLGESFLFSADPINIVGMPVIRQRVMVMDPTTMAGGLDGMGRLDTKLLPAGTSAIPKTNLAIRVRMVDFSGSAPAAMSTAANPVIDGITIASAAGGPSRSSTVNSWLFDTGSGSTFISFAKAQEIGLVPTGTTFDAFVSGYTGAKTSVGGIGGTKTVPIMTLDSIAVPTKQGIDLTWRNVDVMVLDIPGIDGVFGMNLLLPAMTFSTGNLDPATLESLGDMTDIDQLLALFEQYGDLLALLGLSDPTTMPVSNGYFDKIVFDSTTPGRAELRLFSPDIRVAGDANDDGIVDQSDYSLWYNHYGVSGGRADGDVNGDGIIDQADYVMWYMNYGVGGGADVPEPASLALLAIGGLAIMRRRGRAN